MRVLVVDDDPDVLPVLEDMLSGCGIDATGAGSAARALVRSRAQHFDIVLIDAPLPGLACIDLAREIREDGTAVLMIPAGLDVIPQLEDAGLPYLLKPFGGHDLIAAINYVVEDLRPLPSG